MKKENCTIIFSSEEAYKTFDGFRFKQGELLHIDKTKAVFSRKLLGRVVKTLEHFDCSVNISLVAY